MSTLLRVYGRVDRHSAATLFSAAEQEEPVGLVGGEGQADLQAGQPVGQTGGALLADFTLERLP